MHRLRAHAFISATLSLMLALILVPSGTAAAATSTPSSVQSFSTNVGIEGVALYWVRGVIDAGHDAPTSYRLHRSTADGEVDLTVASAGPATTYRDLTLRANLPATYVVYAVNGQGESAASPVTRAEVPSWDGPFEPSQRALLMVWNEAQPRTEATTFPETTQVLPADAAALTYQNSGGLGIALGTRPTSYVSVPRDARDGDYEVGSGPGQLILEASSGVRCDAAGGRPSSGTASVRHAAASLSGWASLELRADLQCGDGRSLHISLQWNTPGPVEGLTAAPLSLEASAGSSADGKMVVANPGTTPLRLSTARILQQSFSAVDTLAVTGSTCTGAVLEPAQSCTVSIRYTPGPLGAQEGNGFLALSSEVGDFELGRVVGQQPAADSAPRLDPKPLGRPGSLLLAWKVSTTIDCRLIGRVSLLDRSANVTAWTSTNGCAESANLIDPAPGAHSYVLVTTTKDGRERSSAPLAVSMPKQWLLLSTKAGIKAYDAEGSGAEGAVVQTGWRSGVDVSPARKTFASNDFFGSDIRVNTLTGGFVGYIDTTGEFADQPQFSPDGSSLAYVRNLTAGAQVTSLVTAPASGSSRREVPGSTGLSSVTWTHDGRLVAGAANGAGLFLVSPTTGARTAIPGTTSGGWPAVSRTGRLAYIATGPDGPATQITITSLTGGPSTSIRIPSQAFDLTWDPTGRYLAATRLWASESTDSGSTSVYDLSTSTARLVRTFPIGGSGVGWLTPATLAPSVTVTVADWTGTTATLTVAATDPDDAPAGLHTECRRDGGAWAACGGSMPLTGQPAGKHTLTARTADPAGNVSAEATRTWQVDPTAPTATLTALPPAVISSTTTLTWSSADSGGSGLRSYDVRVRVAGPAGSLSSYLYPVSWQGVSARSIAPTLTPGSRYCFAVRARDTAGNFSSWTADSCTAAALDDRALTAGAGWTRGTSSAYTNGTYTYTGKTAATLTSPTVSGRRVGLVATVCASCGALDVYQGGVLLGRVSLVRSTTAARQVLWLPASSTARTGAVTLKTAAAKTTYIDGLVSAL